jgi:hypothetical protein
VFFAIDPTDMEVSDCKITQNRDFSHEWVREWAEDAGIDLEDENNAELIEMATDSEGDYISKVSTDSGCAFLFLKDEEENEL